MTSGKPAFASDISQKSNEKEQSEDSNLVIVLEYILKLPRAQGQPQPFLPPCFQQAGRPAGKGQKQENGDERVQHYARKPK